MTPDFSRKTRRIIGDSAYGPELQALAIWMAAERYRPFEVEQHLRRMDYMLGRLPSSSTFATHDADVLAAAFGVERTPRSRGFRFGATHRLYTRFLQSCGRLHVAPSGDPYEALKRAYAGFLIDVRGLSLSSRRHHAQVVADFLRRGLPAGQPLSALTRAAVEQYIQLRSREVCRHSLQHDVAYVRAFLRYAHDHGHAAQRLDAIDTPRTYRGELPPRAMPWPQVEALLASIDRSSRTGWRDLGMLHLIAYYGLRPSEVVALRLDSIDWDAATLHVYQSKTRSTLALPLAEPTLALLRQYLANDRTQGLSGLPQLFQRAFCPYGPLQRHGVNDAFERRAREAGFADLRSHVYRLRHSFAMRLLGAGVGIKLIGDLLGHRSIETTCTYLRLDLSTLRGVALAVPGASAPIGGDHA